MNALRGPDIRTARRSALIPSGVVLSPQEEGLIADRIGYRPVPPPDASPVNWFSSCGHNRSSVSSLSSLEEDDESNDSKSEGQDVRNMVDRDPMSLSRFLLPPQNAVPIQENVQATLEREFPYNPQPASDDNDKGSDSNESSQIISEQRIRDRKPAWRIGIPKGTEIPHLRPPASRTSTTSPISTQMSPSLNLSMSNSPCKTPVEGISPWEATEVFV